MAISTASDMITKALQKIGVLAEGETPTAQQVNDALDSLNLMIDGWSLSSLMTSAQVQEAFSVTAGNATYAFGSGQAFNSPKPHAIISAFVRDSANQDTPLLIVAREVYNNKLDKTVRACPEILFYDSGATQQASQAGTVKLYPTPNANYSLVLTSERPFTTMSNLSDSITFPSGYKRAIIYNLAIELAPDYGVQVSPEIVKIAGESIRALERLNIRNKEEYCKVVFPGQVGSGYNIETDN